MWVMLRTESAFFHQFCGSLWAYIFVYSVICSCPCMPFTTEIFRTNSNSTLGPVSEDAVACEYQGNRWEVCLFWCPWEKEGNRWAKVDENISQQAATSIHTMEWHRTCPHAKVCNECPFGLQPRVDHALWLGFTRCGKLCSTFCWRFSETWRDTWIIWDPFPKQICIFHVSTFAKSFFREIQMYVTCVYMCWLIGRRKLKIKRWYSICV